jgi:hypothetical protein
MTLPTSGTLRMSAIHTEFGGTEKLSAYYRGGTYVPNTTTNSAIPTSGKIKYSEFYGASKTIPGNIMGAATTTYGDISVFTAVGYSNSSDSGDSGGTMSPTTATSHTYTIIRCISGLVGTQNTLIVALVAPLTTSMTSVAFTDNHSVARSFTTASATYSDASGGETQWRWNVTYALFTAGDSYTITFT